MLVFSQTQTIRQYFNVSQFLYHPDEKLSYIINLSGDHSVHLLSKSALEGYAVCRMFIMRRCNIFDISLNTGGKMSSTAAPGRLLPDSTQVKRDQT